MFIIIDYFCGKLQSAVSNMDNDVAHKGIVEKIEGPHVFVRIVQKPACESCAAKNSCSVHKDKTLLVDVITDRQFEKGEAVVLRSTPHMEKKAVLWAYILPLLIIILSLFITINLSGKELLGVVISLSSITLYYVILYFFRNKIHRKFTFKIEHIE